MYKLKAGNLGHSIKVSDYCHGKRTSSHYNMFFFPSGNTFLSNRCKVFPKFTLANSFNLLPQNICFIQHFSCKLLHQISVPLNLTENNFNLLLKYQRVQYVSNPCKYICLQFLKKNSLFSLSFLEMDHLQSLWPFFKFRRYLSKIYFHPSQFSIFNFYPTLVFHSQYCQSWPDSIAWPDGPCFRLCWTY